MTTDDRQEMGRLLLRTFWYFVFNSGPLDCNISVSETAARICEEYDLEPDAAVPSFMERWVGREQLEDVLHGRRLG